MEQPNETKLWTYCTAFRMLEIPKGSDGKNISLVNLNKALQHLGYNMTDDQLNAIIAKILKDTKNFDFGKFCGLIADIDWEADILFTFNLFDKKRVGYLTAEDLREPIEHFSGRNTIRSLIEMLKKLAAINSDGSVSYDEFYDLSKP